MGVRPLIDPGQKAGQDERSRVGRVAPGQMPFFTGGQGLVVSAIGCGAVVRNDPEDVLALSCRLLAGGGRVGRWASGVRRRARGLLAPGTGDSEKKNRESMVWTCHGGLVGSSDSTGSENTVEFTLQTHGRRTCYEANMHRALYRLLPASSGRAAQGERKRGSAARDRLGAIQGSGGRAAGADGKAASFGDARRRGKPRDGDGDAACQSRDRSGAARVADPPLSGH